MLGMIQMSITYQCRVCGSTNITKNGTNRCDSAQYHCKDCGAYQVLELRRERDAEKRQQILRVYRERTSLRGLERIFGVARHVGRRK
jgi:insertion element IS1 protein InsB